MSAGSRPRVGLAHALRLIGRRRLAAGSLGSRTGFGYIARMSTVNPANPLRRSRRNRMLAGVCGGLAEWLGWDPTLVRVLYVAVSIVSAAFPGTLVYIILWLLMPEGD